MEDAAGVSMDVATVIESESVLPPSVIEVLLAHLIEENTSALLDLFHGASLPYFHGIVDISRKVVTDPLSPDRTLEFAVVAAGKEEDGDDAGMTPVLIGIAVGGVPWIVLACAGLAYLVTARRRKKRACSAPGQADSTTHELTGLQFDVEEGLADRVTSGIGEDDDEEDADSSDEEDESSDEEDTDSSDEEDASSDEEDASSDEEDDTSGEENETSKEENEASDEEDVTDTEDERGGTETVDEGSDTESDDEEDETEDEHDEIETVDEGDDTESDVEEDDGDAAERYFLSRYPNEHVQFFLLITDVVVVPSSVTGAASG
jgi:hypothetical protein